VATVILVVTSVSLPYLPNTDLVRVHVKSGNVTQGTVTSSDISQLRFGIWSYCAIESPSGDRNCSKNGHGYSVVFLDKGSNKSVTIKSSFTRGLAVHPAAAGLSFIALLTSFCGNAKAASGVSSLASLVALIAFWLDVALLLSVKYELKKLQYSHFDTNEPVGFWMANFSMILLGAAARQFNLDG